MSVLNPAFGGLWTPPKPHIWVPDPLAFLRRPHKTVPWQPVLPQGAPPPSLVRHSDMQNLTGKTTASYTNQSTDGPLSVAFILWNQSSSRTVTGVTFDGNAMNFATTSSTEGVAIAVIAGAYTNKTLAVTYSGNTANSRMVLASVTGITDDTIEDSQESPRGSGSEADFTGLTGPGAGGIVLCCVGTLFDNADSWTNATAEYEGPSAVYRIHVGYNIGNPAGAIKFGGGGTDIRWGIAISLN